MIGSLAGAGFRNWKRRERNSRQTLENFGGKNGNDSSHRCHTCMRPYLSYSTEVGVRQWQILPNCLAYRRKGLAVLTLIPWPSSHRKPHDIRNNTGRCCAPLRRSSWILPVCQRTASKESVKLSPVHSYKMGPCHSRHAAQASPWTGESTRHCRGAIAILTVLSSTPSRRESCTPKRSLYMQANETFGKSNGLPMEQIPVWIIRSSRQKAWSFNNWRVRSRRSPGN